METKVKSFICKLTTPGLQKRKSTVIKELQTLLKRKTEIAGGYAYEFVATDETLDKLHSFIKTERLCCDFFTFHNTINGDTVTLSITGDEEAKFFLQQEIGL